MEQLLWAILEVLGRIDARGADRRRARADAFINGILRGAGAVVGFALMGTVGVWILQYLAERNLPVISDFLAEVVTMVRMRIQ